jgi:hypothetical protein
MPKLSAAMAARAPAALAVLLLFVPGRVAAQTATVDQVLAALAEVVRDRAKQVASVAIAARIQKQLCKGTVTVQPHRSGPQTTCQKEEARSQRKLTVDAVVPPKGQPTCDDPLTVYLGGRDECRNDGSACNADDVFVGTCRLATKQELPLSDPYLLKSLSQDALDFLLRISASGLSQQQFRDQGLADVAQFLHAVLEKAGSRSSSIGELADPTLALADALDRHVPRATIDTVGRDPRTFELRAAVANLVRPWIAGGCAGGNVKACTGSEAHTWLAESKEAPSEIQCSDFQKSSQARAAAFLALFDTGKPYAAARNDVCEKVPASERPRCGLARVTFNLHAALTRTACGAGAGEAAMRSALRELVYVLGEQQVYRPVLDADANARDAYQRWLASIARLDVRDLPREELAYGIRAMGTYLRALQQDPVATGRWLELLQQDLNGLQGGAGGYSALLHGSALGFGRDPGSAPVRSLRESVKDLLVLPMLVVVRHEQIVDDVDRVRSAALVVVRKIQRDPAEQPRSVEAVLASLSDFVGALAQMTRDLAGKASAQPEGVLDQPAEAKGAGAEDVSSTPDAATLFRVADALAEAATALRLGSSRDWVGLALLASRELESRVKDRSEFERVLPSLRFVRVLLSMYQAADVAEAKAIFAANLEDVASRGRRYDQVAVDAGAFLGVRWGSQRTRVYGADGTSSVTHPYPQLYGLFAPFGIQVTFPISLGGKPRAHAGVLAYPVDLGSYLVVSDSEASKPSWQDAFRLGLSPFLRLDRDLPIILGFGGDVRPRVKDTVEWRAYVHLSLELPLYVLY